MNELYRSTQLLQHLIIFELFYFMSINICIIKTLILFKKFSQNDNTMKWFGHVERMGSQRLTKRVYMRK